MPSLTDDSDYSDSDDEAYIAEFKFPGHTSEPNKCSLVNVMHKGLSTQIVIAKKYIEFNAAIANQC